MEQNFYYTEKKFNDNINEYKKALNNLEIELQKKEYELSSINNLYQDLKKLDDRHRLECENLNEKNIILINEKSSLEEKYTNEIEQLETKYKKKINELEEKLGIYSSFNLESIKNKIENDLKVEYDEKIFAKDQEILEKNQIIEELKNNNVLIKEEAKFEKDSILKDMDVLKNLHKNETNDLIQRIQLLKNNNNNNPPSDNNQSNELAKYKQYNNLLEKENFKLKKEIESLIKEKNELKTNNLLLSEKNEEKRYQLEIKRYINTIENLRAENYSLKNEIQIKNNDAKNIINQKVVLSQNLSNKNLECQNLLNEINVLNNLLKMQQEEYNQNLIESYKNRNEMIVKEKINEERYKKEIQELKSKDNGGDDNLINEINNKEEEIIRLKNIISDIEKESKVDSSLIQKYNFIIKKKNYYKNQCKKANENIKIIMNKLTPELQKEFNSILVKNNNLEISQSD